MARNKMDVSPQLSRGGDAVEPRRIPLPRKPLSPWMRLAHVSRALPGQPAWEARLRTIDDFELVLQIEGSAWIYADAIGGSLEVPPGYLVFIPPDYVHCWGMDPGAHIAVHFDLHAKPDVAPMRHIHYTDRVVSRSPATV
ncbi:MAG TPA: hypothetical protein VEJ63_04750, partial [Planctomycetota bacterium]|nr:hypothetical protein [Planctomycetota bacterium]